MKGGCSLEGYLEELPKKGPKRQSWGQKRLQLRLWHHHVEPRLPEVGQAPSKDSQFQDTFPQKRSEDPELQAPVSEAPEEARICGLGQKSACGAREPAQWVNLLLLEQKDMNSCTSCMQKLTSSIPAQWRQTGGFPRGLRSSQGRTHSRGQ